MRGIKKSILTIFSGIILVTTGASSIQKGDYEKLPSGNDQDTVRSYPDGKYSGQSRYTYIGEPYWGKVSFTLKNGLFTGIDFLIMDSVLHEPFDSLYEKYFKDNDLYIQQCRNDWKGVQSYPQKLMEIQNIDKLDAISGATWSYNIFKASVEEALKRARRNP
ncbi:MAG: FMN-binding protein [Bacteroidia bacterium]|nr:FMN-binding protein [Bacteroidia bacterium]